MSLAAVAGIAAGLLSIAAYPPYIRDILRGETKPQRVTWVVYVALSVVALVGQRGLGATWSLGLAIAQLIGTGAVLVLSVRFGSGGASRLDRICLALAGSALIVLFVFRQDLWAVLLVALTDACGTLPTVIKSWRDPDSETLVTWLFDAGAGGLGLLAVGRLNPQLLLLPGILLLENAIVSAALIASPNRRKSTG